MNYKTILLFAALTTATSFGAVLSPTSESVQPPAEVKIEPLVEKKETLNPALSRICSCESVGIPNGTPRQFNPDGTVVRGKINPHDIGMCQINSDYHEAAAVKMGIDIYTEAGNIKYANYLYQTQGDTPWNWSKACWGQ